MTLFVFPLLFAFRVSLSVLLPIVKAFFFFFMYDRLYLYNSIFLCAADAAAEGRSRRSVAASAGFFVTELRALFTAKYLGRETLIF